MKSLLILFFNILSLWGLKKTLLKPPGSMGSLTRKPSSSGSVSSRTSSACASPAAGKGGSQRLLFIPLARWSLDSHPLSIRLRLFLSGSTGGCGGLTLGCGQAGGEDTSSLTPCFPSVRRWVALVGVPRSHKACTFQC